MGLAGWSAGDGRALTRFPALTSREKYAAILAFLGSQTDIRAGLRSIAEETRGFLPAGFATFLAREEAKFGFNPDVVTILDKAGKANLIKSSIFWTYLYTRRPMTDLGAGKTHGAWTHRIQWILIGRWNAASSAPLGPASTVADLYSTLGSGVARQLHPEIAEQVRTNTLVEKIDTGRTNPFDSLWFNMFDTGDTNATSPEYLHDGVIRFEFPSLYASMQH